MDQISRPMQIALVAVLLFFAVWFVALRPKPAEEAAAPAPTAQEAAPAPGTEGLTNAVEQARDAAATANRGAQRQDSAAEDSGGATPSGTTATPDRPQGASGSRVRQDAPRTRAAAAGAVRIVRAAVGARLAVAIAFVDPLTADARAVREELRHVSRFGGRAVTLSVPIADVARFGFITRDVEVTVAPTVVIVDPRRRATTIVGYADRGEIEQRLADALSVRRG